MKRMKIWLVRSITLLLLAGVVLTLGTLPVSAGHVEPVLNTGDPSCQDLGFDYGFRIDSAPVAGTYMLTSTDGVLTGETPELPDESFTISNVELDGDGVDTIFFDWAATLGIDAVIVKGNAQESGANVYAYDPEELNDQDLHAPVEDDTTDPPAYYGINHVEFCFDIEGPLISLDKDAQTASTVTHTWAVDKSAEPANWDLFRGDTGTSEYTVTVSETADATWTVSGTINIANLSDETASITAISDIITPGDIAASVTCGGTVGPLTVGAGEQIDCSYSATVPDVPDTEATYTNTVSLEVDGDAFITGDNTETFTFAAATVTHVNPTVDVDDNYTDGTVDWEGVSWQDVDGQTSFTYSRTFTCDDEPAVENEVTVTAPDGTAEIVLDAAVATVPVTCYDLDVEKTANTAAVTPYEWSIDKTADAESLSLMPDEPASVGFSVTVDAVLGTETHVVSGTISISNPHPSRAATINAVSDVIGWEGGSLPAGVDCGTEPFDVPANSTYDCTYSASFGEIDTAITYTNVATATLQNYDFDVQMDATATGTAGYEAEQPFSFANETANGTANRCVSVYDDQGDPDDPDNFVLLGELCADEVELPATFTYPRTVSYGAELCGVEDLAYRNRAWVVSGDETLAEGTVAIEVDINCGEGCSPGYWKNHADVWEDFTPDQAVGSVFDVPGDYGLDGDSLLDALRYGGGPGLEGAARILLRASVASVLNAADADVFFPHSVDEVVSMVNDAFASSDRQTMLQLAGELDTANNLGCPLDKDGEREDGDDGDDNGDDDGDDAGDVESPVQEIYEGDLGCSQGFWKNHTAFWVDAYSPDMPLADVFSMASVHGLDEDSLLEALHYGGGPDLSDKARILLRQAVASLLNEAYFEDEYGFSGVVQAVNDALASEDKDTILELAETLDAYNNIACVVIEEEDIEEDDDADTAGRDWIVRMEGAVFLPMLTNQ